MDVFYEESSITRDSAKAEKKNKRVHIFSNIFLALGIIALIFGIYFIPIPAWITWGFICLWLFGMWFALFRWRQRLNVSYDYVFVSGELRIAKVFNVNKRKLVVRLEAESILQIGDVDNTSFDGLRADPSTKTVYCTSNVEPEEDKFFMYILANDNGKKLYVLECREVLLMHMLRFLKRSVLESDYVSQEKKKSQV